MVTRHDAVHIRATRVTRRSSAVEPARHCEGVRRDSSDLHFLRVDADDGVLEERRAARDCETRDAAIDRTGER